jgi:hypothetical protein
MRKEKKTPILNEAKLALSPPKVSKKMSLGDAFRRISYPQPIRHNIEKKFKLKRQNILSPKQNIDEKRLRHVDRKYTEDNALSFDEDESPNNNTSSNKLMIKSKVFIELILENNFYITFMSVVTIYSLFGNNIKIAFVDPSHDVIFNSLSSLTICLFLIEIILSCFANLDYPWSFFFWLDIISTLSLCLEIDWVAMPLLSMLSDEKYIFI